MLVFNLFITASTYIVKDFLLDISFIKYWTGMFFAYYIVGESFLLLDYFDQYKLKSTTTTKISSEKIYKTTIKNNLLFVPFLAVYYNYFINYLQPTFYVVFLETAAYAVIFLGVFEIGHYLLHSKKLYKYHKRHHSTYADRAITAYYMDKLDFLCEVLFPFFIGPFIIRGCHTSFIMWSIIGLLNSLVNHSGCDFKYVTSKVHFYHHNNKIM